MRMSSSVVYRDPVVLELPLLVGAIKGEETLSYESSLQAVSILQNAFSDGFDTEKCAQMEPEINGLNIKCPHCCIEMKGIGQLVNHALNSQHLKKMYSAGESVTQEDIGFWRELLKEYPRTKAA